MADWNGERFVSAPKSLRVLDCVNCANCLKWNENVTQVPMAAIRPSQLIAFSLYHLGFCEARRQIMPKSGYCNQFEKL